MKRPKPIAGFKRLIHRSETITEVVRETTSGGIIFRPGKKPGQVEILLIQDAKNRWTIPKGHVEPNEEPRLTAEREIKEETGLAEVKVMDWLGKVNFRYRRSQTLVLMTMHIYLVKAVGDTTRLHPEDWLNDIRWFPAHEAADKIEYEDISKLLLSGMKRIREKKL